MRRYFDGFDDYASMVAAFMDGGWDYEKREKRPIVLPDGFPSDADILFAAYGTEEAYSGSATVVFRVGAELMLNSAGHCSCYGLEGQWEPARTIREALGTLSSEYSEEARAGWRELLASLAPEVSP